MDSNDKTLRWKLNQVIFSEATSGTGKKTVQSQGEEGQREKGPESVQQWRTH